MKTLNIYERTFGVEIEFFGCRRTTVADKLLEKGIKAEVQGYNHYDSKSVWKLVTDSSVTNTGTYNDALFGNAPGNEMVSPILKGEEGYRQLKVVCEVLTECGAKVDKTCGVHVHLQAQDMSLQDWKNTICMYNNFQYTIDRFLPVSRRDNGFCRKFTEDNIKAIMNLKSLSGLENLATGMSGIDRYHIINISAYLRHGTIEFRQHSGTTDYEKIYNWIVLMMSIQHYSMNTECVGNRKFTADGIQQWNNFTAKLKTAGVDKDVRKYFFERRKHFITVGLNEWVA